MASPRESMVNVRGCNINLREAGAGRPLLFLHGAQGYLGFPPFLESLAKRYRVLAPDHPGFGKSERPEWIDNVSDLAYFYMDLMDQLDLKDALVVGNSIGAWTAMDMAIRSSKRIAGLVLIAAAGIHVKGVQKADMFMPSFDELVRMQYVDEALIAKRIEDEHNPELFTMLARNRIMAAKLCWQPRLFDPHLERWLHRIDVPSLIVWGEQDRIIPPTYAAAFKDLIPGSQVVMIPNCGHMPHVEKPEAFLNALNAFAEGRKLI
jgi:pimeloyl-ACP methyl ester carboxylesterase